MRRALVAAQLALVVTACGFSLGKPSEELKSPTRLDLPVGSYLAIDWTVDEWIVVGYVPPESATARAGDRIWRLRPDGSDFQEVPTPDRDDCLVSDAYTPTALADGLVAFWFGCRTLGNVGPSFLEATDFAGSAEVLAPLDYNPNRIVWDLAAGAGLIGAGSGICDGFVRITDDGIAPLPLEVGEGDQRFRVDEYFYDSRPCETQGRATLPSRTADGRQVAFFASPESTGGGFGSRLDLPWNIYVVDEPMETSTPVELLSGVRHPRGLRWSPDGETLAFSGEIDGTSGSWLFSPSDKSLIRFSDIRLAWLAWSPDGRRLVGVEDDQAEPFHSHLVMFEMR